MVAASKVEGEQANEFSYTASVPTSFSEVHTEGGSGLFQGLPSSDMVTSKRPMFTGCWREKLVFPVVASIVGLLLSVSFCFVLRRRGLSWGVEKRRLADGAELSSDEVSEDKTCDNILSGIHTRSPSGSTSGEPEGSDSSIERQRKSKASAPKELSPDVLGAASEASARHGEVSVPGTSGGSSKSKSARKRIAPPEESDQLEGPTRKAARAGLESFSRHTSGKPSTSTGKQPDGEEPSTSSGTRKGPHDEQPSTSSGRKKRPDAKEPSTSSLTGLGDEASTSREGSDDDTAPIPTPRWPSLGPYFLRLPVLQHGVTARRFNAAALELPVNPKVSLAGQLLRVWKYLHRDELTEHEVNGLMDDSEVLVRVALRDITSSRKCTDSAAIVEDLARRFLVLNALHSVSKVVGDSMQMGLWWGNFAGSISNRCSCSSLVESSNEQTDLAEQLKVAIQDYKAGGEPSSTAVLRLKYNLFYSSLAGTSAFQSLVRDL